ncbi:putative amino acid transporter, transmembrane domain-containing protein [Helianthus anomalus]
MKIDEEFVPDRRMEVETDDEDNEAERDCDDDDEEEETGSDCESELPPSVNHFHNWPQTYRQSMDMYTMPLHSVNSFRGTSELNLPIKTSFGPLTPTQTHERDGLCKPLLKAKSLGKDHVPVSTSPMKLSQTSNITISGLPPPVEQCSFSQAVLNGILFLIIIIATMFLLLIVMYILLYAAINVLCGIGILSMPYAFKEGGWLSLVLLMVFGVICCYTGILLKICLEKCHGLQTYPDIGQAAFGYFGRVCIASSCVEYLIMMNDNLSALFPHAHLDIGGIIHLDSYLFCAIISTLVILPTVWLRNLSLLSYISAGGVVTLAAVVVCLLWLGVVDGMEYHPSRTALNLGNLPVAVGLIGFCYGSHSVFPNIYTSMKEPSRYPSALLIRSLLLLSS